MVGGGDIGAALTAPRRRARAVVRIKERCILGSSVRWLLMKGDGGEREEASMRIDVSLTAEPYGSYAKKD